MNGRQTLVDPTASRWVLWWVAIYTRGLPVPVASARADEIASDLFEHNAAATSAGVSRRAVTRSVFLRAFRGMGADLLWRERQLRNVEAARLDTAGATVRRRHARLLTSVLIVQGLVTVLAVLGTIRVLVNVSSSTPTKTPAIVGVLALVAVVAFVLTTRPSTRTAGTVVFAAVALPLTWAASYATMSISATLASWIEVALQPFIALSHLLGIVAILTPGLALTVFFWVAATRFHATTRRLRAIPA